MRTLFTIMCILIWIACLPFIIFGFVFGFIEKSFILGREKFDDFDNEMEKKTEEYENISR